MNAFVRICQSVFIFALLGIFTQRADGAKAGSVVKLTRNNFDTTVGGPDPVMVEFYAPWCGHCKSLAPIYKAAAKELKEDGITLAKVDATEEQGLATQYNVEGFPTMKVFRNGKPLATYNGPRSSEAIADYMRRVRENPDSAAIEEEEMPTGMGDEEEGDEERMPPGMSDEEDAPKEQNEKDAEGALPLDEYTFDKIVGSGTFHVLVKFDEAYPYGYAQEEFVKFTSRVAASTSRADFLVTTVGLEDWGENVNAELHKRFNIKKKDWPVYLLFNKERPTVPIKFDGNPTVDSLSAFLRANTGVWVGRPGCLEDFDKLADEYVAAHKKNEEHHTILEKAKTVLTSVAHAVEKKRAEYYVKVMEKIGAKGKKFPKIEFVRLEKLSSSRAVAEHKKAEIETKMNILSAFLWTGEEGWIEEMDGLARGFAKAEPEEQQRRITEAETVLEQLQKADVGSGALNAANYYLEVMQKLQASKSPDEFTRDEHDKLEEDLHHLDTPDEERPSLRTKTSVLRHFRS